MKVYNNIENLNISEIEKLELTKHIVNLAAHRKDSIWTEYYVSTYLQTDKLFRKWCDDSYPELKKFTSPNGALKVNEAEKMRKILLDVIEDDKYSFGHLYHCLGSEQNRKKGYVEYKCVFKQEEIGYAVDFDINDLIEQADGIDDLRNRLNFINKKKTASDLSAYNGALKEKFTQLCLNYEQAISKEIQLFGIKNDVATENPLGHDWDGEQLGHIAKELRKLGRISNEANFIDVVNGNTIGSIDWKCGNQEDFNNFILRFLNL